DAAGSSQRTGQVKAPRVAAQDVSAGGGGGVELRHQVPAVIQVTAIGVGAGGRVNGTLLHPTAEIVVLEFERAVRETGVQRRRGGRHLHQAVLRVVDVVPYAVRAEIPVGIVGERLQRLRHE